MHEKGNFHNNTITFLLFLKWLNMKKPLHKKKTQPAAKKPLPGARTEKDADDLVHSHEEEPPTEAGEEDLDDLIHRPHKPDSVNKSKQEDPDDLTHSTSQEEEDNQ
jgi:hypothetical protein